MHAVGSLILSAAAVAALGACDPGYGIGARIRLAPATTDSCITAAIRRSLGRFAVDTVDRRQGSYLPLALRDSTGFWSHAYLMVGSVRDSTFPLELETSWIGNARKFPIDEQRRFIAEATTVLDSIHAWCGSTQPAQIECIAKGFGGHPACEGST